SARSPSGRMIRHPIRKILSLFSIVLSNYSPPRSPAHKKWNMNVRLNELIASLPREDSKTEPGFAREELERIFADLAMRPAPTGSLRRLWNVSELSVQIAMAYGLNRVRGWFA